MIKPVECQSNGSDFGGSSPYSGHYLSYKQLAKFCHLCLKWCNLLFFHCESKKVWIHFSSACHVANPTKYACPHCNWLSSYQKCLSTLDFDGLFSNLSHVRSFCVLMQAASTDINCCFIWNLYTLACHNLSLIVNLHAQFYSLKSSTCLMWVMRG